MNKLRAMWRQRKIIVPIVLALVTVVNFALPAYANFTHVSTCRTYIDTVNGVQKDGGIVCAQVVAEGIVHYSGHYKPVIAWGPAYNPNNGPSIIYIDYIIMYRNGVVSTRKDPDQGYTFLTYSTETLDGIGYDCKPSDPHSMVLSTGIRYKFHYLSQPVGTWSGFHTFASSNFSGGCN